MILRKIFELNVINNFIFLISTAFIILYKTIDFSEKSKKEKQNSWILIVIILLFCNLRFYTTLVIILLTIIELSIYPIIKLFLNQSKDKEKLSSLNFMFNINICGSLIFMYSIRAIIIKYRSMIIYFNLHWNKEILISLFFSLILLTKIPIIFIQFWLSKAHVTASRSCSIILARIILKLGSYGILKFWSFIKFNLINYQVFNFSLNISCLIFICIIIYRFNDLKLLVAYSSILHMAITIPFTMQLKTIGVIRRLIVFVRHGLISCIFFYLISSIYEIRFRRTMERNKNIESMNKTIRMLTFLIIFLNLGVPPLIIMYSEIIFISVIMEFSKYLCLNLFLVSILFVGFNIIIVLSFNFGKKIVKIKKYLNIKINIANSMIALFLFILPMSMC